MSGVRRHRVVIEAGGQTLYTSPLSRRTEARWVVGFEVVLGALLAALDGGVITSIHGCGE